MKMNLRSVGVALVMATAFVTPSLAEDNVSSDQIIKALQPKPLTRSLTAPRVDPAATAKQDQFVDSLRNRRTRSLSSGERDQIATIASEKPNIDLEVTFDYNSADISASSMPNVQALGSALSNPSLKGATFLVAGHTDAQGGEAYNQDLSERRADAIKKYLVDHYSISAADLVTVGYGKSKPKDASAPMDPANRRVQVVNMKSSASN